MFTLTERRTGLAVGTGLRSVRPKLSLSELGNCVKVDVAVLGQIVTNSPYILCGRKTTLN